MLCLDRQILKAPGSGCLTLLLRNPRLFIVEQRLNLVGRLMRRWKLEETLAAWHKSRCTNQPD